MDLLAQATLATALVPASAFVIARVYGVLRDLSFGPRARGAPPPEAQTKGFAAYAQLLKPDHHSARRLQDRYHLLLAMAVASLLVGFVVFSAEITVLPRAEFMHGLAAWVDLTALVTTLACALAARAVMRRWIWQRSKAELLRQSLFVDEGLAPANGVDLDLTSRFLALASRIDQQMPRQPHLIAPYVRDYWRSKSAAILSRANLSTQIAEPLSKLYRIHRVEYQAQWFKTSRRRLIRTEEGKAAVLTALFLVGLATAAAKVWLMARGGHGLSMNVASLLFLLSIGGATAMSALFVNQNSRSLIHRYSVQQDVIARFWEKAFNAQTLLSLSEIMQFETLMIDELVDFVEITRRDVIELSPA